MKYRVRRELSRSSCAADMTRAPAMVESNSFGCAHHTAIFFTLSWTCEQDWVKPMLLTATMAPFANASHQFGCEV